MLDEDGYLTITDRISDIIIRGGENISAQEIEELMLGMDDGDGRGRGVRAGCSTGRARLGRADASGRA